MSTMRAKMTDERLREIAAALDTMTYGQVCAKFKCSRSTAAKADKLFGNRPEYRRPGALTRFERFVLSELRKAGPLPKRGFARHLGVSLQVVSTTLEDLARAGAASETQNGNRRLWRAAA